MDRIYNQRKTFIDIEEMDRDQNTLYEMIHSLQRAINTVAHKNHVEGLIEAVMAHLDAQIRFEERVMASNNYPLAFAHVEVHNVIRDQFKSILASIYCESINNKNIGKLLINTHRHHFTYFDEIMFHYIIDQYTLTSVDDGLGI